MVFQPIVSFQSLCNANDLTGFELVEAWNYGTVRKKLNVTG